MNKITVHLKCILVVLAIFVMTEYPARGCSTFCIDTDNALVIGRNYDWHFGEGYIMVNKRDQEKIAFRYWEESPVKPATWTSKYGSITFNQYGRDIAFSGINEAGLVVSELWLEKTQYPSADARTSMSVDQYLQYILDNFASVDEITASDSLVRVRPTGGNFTKIHFIAFDSTGNGAAIEFIDGKMVSHQGSDMPVKAITNNTYEASLAYYDRGIVPDVSNKSSLARFCRAASLSGNYTPVSSGPVIDYSFKILEAVAQEKWTKFSIVFDVKNSRIYFRSLTCPAVKYFDFNRFDFSCQTVSKVLNINTDASGDVTDLFIDYTTEINEKLIRDAWTDLGYTNIYPPALELVSEYPEKFVCTE